MWTKFIKELIKNSLKFVMIAKGYPVGEVCRSLAARRDLALRNGEMPKSFLSRNGPFVPELSYMRELFFEMYGNTSVREDIFHSQSSDIVVAYLSLRNDSGVCTEGLVIDDGIDTFYACRWADSNYMHPAINCVSSRDGSKPDSFDLIEEEFRNYVKRWLPKVSSRKKILDMKKTG